MNAINSRFHPASSKGVSSLISLLTIIFPQQLEWSEFKTIAEELHLTNVAFEIFQIKETELNQFLENFKTKDDKAYDVRGLLLLNIQDVPQEFQLQFDFCLYETFYDEVDIGIIEELRFKIAEFI